MSLSEWSGDLFTKRLRPLTMKYPSGKILTGIYGTSGSNDDLFNRVSAIKDGSADAVQYAYNGLATPVKTTCPQPGLALDYTASTALDRFGRIIDHAWKSGATDVVRIQHGYDRMGNRNYRKDMVSTTNSELYTYDGVNQVKSLNRGTLNSTNNGITGSNFTETWNFDGTGNWLQYNCAGTVENRTHNKANEIQTTCTHDQNGNMTVMPGLNGKYDAWNRLVEVRNASDALLAIYAYNGLNQRVRKTVGSTVTTSFFNGWWQELEAKTGNETTTFVWGIRYVDDLLYRDKGEERLYSLADPNWNVVAITDTSGTVQERMRYDAFGKVTWLDAAFTAKASSGFVWNRTFTGQVLDSETGLMLYRMRYYNTGLGRFIHRDPIEYLACDVNLMRYVFNMSVDFVDSWGLQFFDPPRQVSEPKPTSDSTVPIFNPPTLSAPSRKPIFGLNAPRINLPEPGNLLFPIPAYQPPPWLQYPLQNDRAGDIFNEWNARNNRSTGNSDLDALIQEIESLKRGLPPEVQRFGEKYGGGWYKNPVKKGLDQLWNQGKPPTYENPPGGKKYYTIPLPKCEF